MSGVLGEIRDAPVTAPEGRGLCPPKGGHFLRQEGAVIFNPAFFLSMRKKAPLTVERKNGKGGVCVGTNFTSLTLPQAAGLVRFVVPPFPARTASLGSRGSPIFAIPLKTTKKRADAPFLDHSRSLVCAKVDYKSTKRDADVYPVVRRGSRNTLASLSTSIRQIFNGR